MNLLKKGYYLLLVLLLSITVSCEDNEDGIDTIKGLDFNIATLSSKGNKVGVLPVSAYGNGSIVYTVDFGAIADDDTDEFRTSGPLVTYEYPEETATYTITVTAALDGVSDVSLTKEHTVTYSVVVAPPAGGGSPLAGSWRIAPTAGAFGVGPAIGDISWFSNATGDLTTRACFFDDQYVFNADGSFQNVLGADTFLEAWQGTTPDACGTPVFPHDGTATATYAYDETAGTLTIDGKGAFLGLAKVNNSGELAAPGDAPDSITYDVTEFDEAAGTMTLDINFGPGYWRFKLLRDAPPLVGTWKIAPTAGAFGVGPAIGDISWFSNATGDLTTRACFFDDEYVFNADGSFQNVLGADTFLEAWQGTTPDACGTPVFPHDGTATATYAYDETAGTITIDGKGAFLGLAKVNNAGELAAPGDAPDSITYDVTEFDEAAGTITLDINFGPGYWRYKLVKQ
jgi:cytochrome oxidase Cu insertion factor (SCO1/SenC/PrrC family)